MTKPVKILKLSNGGQPIGWVSRRAATMYSVKGLIAWSPVDPTIKMRGGTNRITAQETVIELPEIIAVVGEAFQTNKVRLTNGNLFKRDRWRCAYCGFSFMESALSCEHIIPTSRSGPNDWMNVVTACNPCNRRKGDKTPSEANMEMLYDPWRPTRVEMLYLSGAHFMTEAQRAFLMDFIPEHSRALDELSAEDMKNLKIHDVREKEEL